MFFFKKLKNFKISQSKIFEVATLITSTYFVRSFA